MKIFRVTRNSSFFKSLNQPAIDGGIDESQTSGFGSPGDKECAQEPLAAAPSLNAPDPTLSELANTPHDKADLPSSGNHILVPESQTRASEPEGQPPLLRSTRK